MFFSKKVVSKSSNTTSTATSTIGVEETGTFSIKVDGKVVYEGKNGSLKVEQSGNTRYGLSVIINGNVNGDVTVPLDLSCGDVSGDVDAGLGVNCKNVNGDVTAGLGVTCGDVQGNVDAGMDANAKNVKGGLSAGMNIKVG